MKLSDSLRAPSWVVIQLLERCNLRCAMCYEWGDSGAYHAHAKPAALELPLVLRIVDECLPAKPVFEFFGGEPLLYPGIWEVISAIRAGGCDVTFPTNGTLLDEHAERLVDTAPTRLWVSLDGPEAINDRQRGRGVYARAIRGLERIRRVRAAQHSAFPQLGVTYIVTPANWEHIEAFFLRGIDLSLLDGVSIELQSYATADQAARYAELLRTEFGVADAPCASAYVRAPETFDGIDRASVAAQMTNVRAACEERGIAFHCQPATLDAGNIDHYFSARWDAMADRRTRCGVPWLSAEISARGDVTTCHTFYDLPLGNVHEQSLLEIWRGPRIEQLRRHLRNELLPICTACCRYYGGAGAMTMRHRDNQPVGARPDGR